MRKWLVLYLILYFATACDTDNDCLRQEVCTGSSCKHKGLFPISIYDVLGAFCVLIVSALANASGLGGGPLMTIILLVIINFHTPNSVSLSQVTVFAGTCLAAGSRIHLRHPTRDKPAIDYELLLLTITPLLLGTTLGVLLEQYSPSWVILSLLTFILSWITYEAGVGAFKAYNLENKERAQQLLNEEAEDGDVTYVTSDLIAIPLRRIVDSERRIAPPLIVTLLFFIYTFMVISSLIRGGRRIESIVGLKFCEGSYWIATYTFMGISIFISILIILYLKWRTRQKINVGYNFDDYDLIWNYTPSLICFGSALVAGMTAGFFSIGGGLVMSPIMLKLGLRPQVVVSTSSVLYVLTSSLAVILHTVSGNIDLDYSLWLAVFSLIGSSIGIVGMKILVKRFQRTSIMILAMTGLLALCTVIIPAYALSRYDEFSKGSRKSMCFSDEQ
jgi:uncharacterized membrane protein YfcA